MFKSGGWRRGGPQEWIRQLLAREKGRNFLVKQTSGVSARRSTGLRDSVPVARGRRPEESCIARAPVCPSVRPAYRGGVRACRHFVQVLHQRLRAASTHVLRFVRAESFARGPAPHCGADFSKRMTRRAFALGPFLPGGCHLVALFHSYGSGRAGAGIAPVNPAAAVMWFLPPSPFSNPSRRSEPT